MGAYLYWHSSSMKFVYTLALHSHFPILKHKSDTYRTSIVRLTPQQSSQTITHYA